MAPTIHTVKPPTRWLKKHSANPRIGSTRVPEMNPKGRKKTGPSLVEIAIPNPDFFYDIPSTLPLVGSSEGFVRSFTNFLYLITIGVFVATYVFYSLPAQLLSDESVVTSEWEKTGYTCKLLQKVPIGGFSTDWTFDECIAATSSPNTGHDFDSYRYQGFLIYIYSR